ncbi:hypothetical protein [Aliivibrio fischeri]|uniref:hypothetical protein n=1 Tax=Aliivibrio fischeri TaxID=668 RepID=UPI0007C57849|nr:hypothetical protein [Aliivibrio fischeri]
MKDTSKYQLVFNQKLFTEQDIQTHSEQSRNKWFKIINQLKSVEIPNEYISYYGNEEHGIIWMKDGIDVMINTIYSMFPKDTPAFEINITDTCEWGASCFLNVLDESETSACFLLNVEEQ